MHNNTYRLYPEPTYYVCMYLYGNPCSSFVGNLPGGSADEKAQAKHAQFLRSDTGQAIRVIWSIRWF